jgi:hypothetical protein
VKGRGYERMQRELRFEALRERECVASYAAQTSASVAS